MPTIAQVTAALEAIAPLALAADWDAVGLLVGPRSDGISRVMTCLSLTPETAAEAVRERVDLVVAHHPLPFRPVPRITGDTATGRVLLQLIGAGVGVWSSHTAWDSAAGGINDQLAALLGLEHVAPLEHSPLHPLAGFGRAGTAGAGWSVGRLARHAADRLGGGGAQLSGDAARPAGRVGIVCGSGGDAVATAAAAGCDTFLTGEIRLHDALHARALGMAVIAVGHHASERFSLDALARRLAEAVAGLSCWASRDETDPLPWLA
jgi:dinuclear metal center YbgI/SA1388 family protein